MSQNRLLTVYMTLEWLIAAYFGVLMRGMTLWFIHGLSNLDIPLAMGIVWVTLTVPLFVRRWPEFWRRVPRFAQWAIAFLMGYTGADFAAQVAD